MRFWHHANGTEAEGRGLAAAADEDGHGTRMAGVLAAIGGNGKAFDGDLATDTVGLMSSGASLLVCRFIGADGWGRFSDAVRCFQWCLDQKAAVSRESCHDLMLLQ